ncbi:MAG TPA: flagellin [Phycisphaerales bacterium]|nr:flagellin [Phycisphaerales bacterium]|tara:strand:- start:5638 stop:7122 length:1485 start_codon:yes stop_codon:yes gene_type:complete
MTTINTNVSSLIGQRILQSNNKGLSQSLERLSTGLKINRGSDGPAGLIASESLRSEKEKISAAIGNAERADQVINIAEGGLNEVQSMLTELQGLVSETANDTGLSTEEKEANQFQVDQILQTIDRISATTSFGDVKLLNGSQDFQTSSVHANVTDFQINAAKFEAGSSVAVQAVVTASAQHAGVFLSTGTLDLTNATDTFSFELGSTEGTREFSFSSGTTAAQMATTINQFKSVTGVSAAVVSGGIMLKTEGYGSDEFVSFDITNLAGQAGDIYTLSANDDTNVNAGVALAATTSVRDEGQDIAGMINGTVARGDGLNMSVSSDGLDVELSLNATAGRALGTTAALTVTGGGATFNIGAEINMANQIRVGMQSVAARNIGNSTDGFLDSLASGGTNSLLSDNLDDAQKIVDNAIDHVSKMRGRLGSVQSNVIGSTINSLNIAYENTSAAESAIRDTDFAEETASLTRNQILVSAATNVVAMSNARPQSVLGLLG